jgi:hypothetical protein
VAESFLKLTDKRPELAETYFRLGYHLRKLEESKLATRCFTEVQNQLATLDDPSKTEMLSARLALATGDAKAFYKIKDRKKAPTVDGDLSDWVKEKSINLNSSSGFLYGTAPLRSAHDLAGSITVLQTETDLYIAGSITDDSLVTVDEQHEDMVGLYFDLRPGAGSYMSRNFEPGDGCFNFYVVAPSSTNPKARLKISQQTPYEITSARTDSGYVFELKLPMTTFGKWITVESKRFGLGVEVIDYDSATDPKQSKAIGFLMPTAGPGESPRPELFGVAEF